MVGLHLKIFPSPSCAVFLNVWWCIKAQLGPFRELNKYEFSCRPKPCDFFFHSFQLNFTLISLLWNFLERILNLLPPIEKTISSMTKSFGMDVLCYTLLVFCKICVLKNQQECDSRLLFSFFSLGIRTKADQKNKSNKSWRSCSVYIF